MRAARRSRRRRLRFFWVLRPRALQLGAEAVADERVDGLVGHVEARTRRAATPAPRRSWRTPSGRPSRRPERGRAPAPGASAAPVRGRASTASGARRGRRRGSGGAKPVSVLRWTARRSATSVRVDGRAGGEEDEGVEAALALGVEFCPEPSGQVAGVLRDGRWRGVRHEGNRGCPANLANRYHMIRAGSTPDPRPTGGVHRQPGRESLERTERAGASPHPPFSPPLPPPPLSRSTPSAGSRRASRR